MAAPRCAKSLRRKALRRLKIYKKNPPHPLTEAKRATTKGNPSRL